MHLCPSLTNKKNKSGIWMPNVRLVVRDRPTDCCGCAPVDDGYLELEMPEISPVPVPVSVGPSTLHTLSSGVRDGSASVTSTSLTAGRLLRCLALSACGRIGVWEGAGGDMGRERKEKPDRCVKLSFEIGLCICLCLSTLRTVIEKTEAPERSRIANTVAVEHPSIFSSIGDPV
uniref:Uncharacterized protein n=1 Tax=Anopheles maculatus TaxID=74869 RepID=A0A182SQZ9_9DIPT